MLDRVLLFNKILNYGPILTIHTFKIVVYDVLIDNLY